MDTQPIRSEDTSSAYKPTAEFNIAAAFPVTDEITRKVARAKWRHRATRLSSPAGLLFCVGAGILGALALDHLRRPHH